MGPIISWISNISWRIRSQIFSVFALNSYFLQVRTICAPGFNCYSCPAATFACPLGVIANFTSLRLVPYTAIAVIGIIALFSGRLICGWVCPFGFLQDALYKIPTKKVRFNRRLRFTKYAVLAIMILAIPFF